MTPSRIRPQHVLWAEEQLEAAETAVLARNGTHAAHAGLAKLPPTIGHPKFWWLSVVETVKDANASAPLPPRLPPWAPASLFITGRRRVRGRRRRCRASRRRISRTSRYWTTPTPTVSAMGI
jgi:hypothetical protein